MIRNQEADFIAVRVQDPRIQNEGSWNSYVDYKIFLHTNSKAFTAKTSCVRRRYSEFVWLKKQLQKNAGLVPVPDLPGKSFFSFSNEDFLEGRRKGLQAFLDKVVHTTVCLSDSQLHLFLQTQLPIGHIQDCVQGHTPYSVTDAILTYASSNQGLVQAQDDDSIKEPSLTVSYESMESPASHQPCLQTEQIFSCERFSCDPDPLEGLLELCDQHRLQKKSSVKISEKKNLLEAVVECVCEPTGTFFLGDGLEDDQHLTPDEENPQTSCQNETPVKERLPLKHCGVDSVFKEESTKREEYKRIVTLGADKETVCDVKTVLQSHLKETDQISFKSDQNRPEIENTENPNCEPEKCVNSTLLDVKDETVDLIQPHISYIKTSSHNILHLQVNGYPEKMEHISPLENEHLQYLTSVHLNSITQVDSGDLTKSNDFGILESSHVHGLVLSKHPELSLDVSEETH